MNSSRKPTTGNGQPGTPPEFPEPEPATPTIPVPLEPGTPDPGLPEAPPPMQPDDPTNPIETPEPDPTNLWPNTDWDEPREQDTDRDGVPDRFEVEQPESVDEAGPSAAELS